MAKFDYFRKRVLPHVPGCSEPLLDQAILDTAIDFCRDTQVVTMEIDAFETEANTADYDLDVPAGYELEQMVNVWVDGLPISPPSLDVLSMTAFGENPSPGRPTAYSQPDEMTLRLYPTPDMAYTITGSVVVRPSTTATTLPDVLEKRWTDPIVAGALMRLLVIPGQPFTNVSMVKLWGPQYNDGVVRAKIAASRMNNSRAVMSVSLGRAFA